MSFKNFRVLFLAIALCLSLQVAAKAQEVVIWQQSINYSSFSDFGPSQKAGNAQYAINSELADDINMVGTINRVEVQGYRGGGCSGGDTVILNYFYGVTVKFYAFGADNKPGALQSEYFIAKGDPNLLYYTFGLNDFRVRLANPFQATGKHFLTVQVVLDPAVAPSPCWGPKWYWRGASADAIRGEAPYFRENPSAPWGREEYNDGRYDLAMRLWGTRTLVTPPAVSGISASTLPQAGRVKITGTNFGATQGTSTVRINGAVAPVSKWTETEIIAYVSDASTLGAGSVQVITQGGASNSLPVTVTARPPANGRVKWRFQADAGSIFGRPAVGADGTVYAVDHRGHLYALSPEGGIKWIFTADTYALQNVSIGLDGTIHYAAGNEIYGVNPNGTLRWRVENVNGGSVAAGPNVGPDGNIYAVFDNTIANGLSAVTISPAGQVLDNDPQYFEARGAAAGVREIVFGAPGQYYFILNNLNENKSGFNFFALGGNFRFAQGRFYGQPAVAPDGTIYAIDASTTLLSAIDPTSGNVIRTFGSRKMPDVGSDGNIYAVGNLSSVFSFTPSGAERWQFQSFGFTGDPIVSPNNEVTVVDAYHIAEPGAIQGINAANGALAWQVNLPEENGGYVRALSRPRFSNDSSTVYYGMNVNDYAADVYTYLYAVSASISLPCSVGISPSNNSFPYNGGTGNLNVSATNANCAWTATSSADWINVHNTSGNGNAALTYTVSANPDFTARTGTITVGGRAFTVTQEARTTTTNVAITYPASGAVFTLPTNLFISANANNPGGTVARVEFYANSELIGTDVSAPFQIVWNDVFATNYTLIAKSFDGNGVVTESAPVTITVNPVPPPEPAPLPIPPPTLTSPTENQVFVAGGNITFSATPGATQYPTSRVEFYMGTTLIGSAASSPYSFTLSNVPAGVYTVSARTIAVTGAMASSQPVDISVTPERISPVAKPFDFDGDGKTDISIYRPTVGEWWILKSSNGSNAAFQFGASSDRIVPADFTGDGKTDVAFWRGSTGEWFILRSEDSSYYSFPFGASGDIPAPADYDGDGKADAAVFRPADSTWYVSKSSGGTIIQQFGANGDAPVVADYDGDNKADIAIYRASLGQWWIQRSTGGVIAFTFGNSADKPVQGDYTGDGKADVAFFRPSTGEWFILRSENASYYSFPFGTVADTPTPGDFDGDGRFDATVFRASGSTWYSQRSTAGTLILGFGQSGDAPIPNAFVP